MKTERLIEVFCHRCWQRTITRLRVGEEEKLPAWYETHGWKRIDGHLVCENCQSTEKAS